MTYSQVVSRVSRSARRVNKKGKKTCVTSGRKCSESLEKYGHAGLLVKMCLESSTWHSTMCALRWKSSVTKRGRLLFRLLASVPSTCVQGFGSLPVETLDGFLPTPTAQDAKNITCPPSQAVRDSIPGVIARTSPGGLLNPRFVENLMSFPVEWTQLNLSAMQSIRESRTKSSRSSSRSNSEKKRTKGRQRNR